MRTCPAIPLACITAMMLAPSFALPQQQRPTQVITGPVRPILFFDPIRTLTLGFANFNDCFYCY
jgi:hypothetical protein